MNFTRFALLAVLLSASTAGPAEARPPTQAGRYVRPVYCRQFPLSAYKSLFAALDTNQNGYLSAGEFQVHRNQMHGPGVLQPCRIAYDPGGYERLTGPKGMTLSQFKVHLQEMVKRAALGPPPPGQGHF